MSRAAFLGTKLYSGETSENWLEFSFFRIVKTALGGALMLISWGIFLRGVLSVTIANTILRIGWSSTPNSTPAIANRALSDRQILMKLNLVRRLASPSH